MRLRAILTCVCLFLSLFSTESSAAAGRRVALVIGNSAYRNVPPLGNTIADAVGLAQLFRSAGFETVISRTDLGVLDFKRTIREFLLTAEGADIAVVYYAGHGIEIAGTNYLVPIDAKLSRDYDVEDEAVALDRIIWALQSVKRLRLILLDACRDNPFPVRMRSVQVRAIAGGGLGQPIDVGADTLVAYAAKAGSKSFDGDGPNSPYATALLRHLAEPGLDIRIALGQVRDDVLAMTGGQQEPFIYGSLGGATIALVPPVADKIAAPLGTVGAASKPPPPSALAPQPVAASPTPAPQTSDAASCSRDEQRLAQLRAEPARDQIVKFGKELVCARLQAQVQRMLESVGPGPAGQAAVNDTPRQQQAELRSAPTEDPCLRDAARLQRLRAEPNLDELRKFEHDLTCEQIRPQLRRLRESVGP
jgi:hypothetical protein